MIQKFLDWFSQKEEKKILHEPAKAAAPIVTEPSLQNFFAHNTYQIDAIELDPAQLKNFLKEHLSGVDKFDPAYHHMTEALNIASRDSTVLSPQQKGTSINALIGEDDALALIHLLRWKTGLVCPYCGSSNVIRKNPPALKYQCQDCEGGSDRGGFDELTGYFERGDKRTARLWVLIHFLKIFMPTAHIAKLLGLSFDQVLRIMSMMSPQHIVDQPKQRKRSSTAP